ncbi:MAG: DNA polymerase III subunit beta [Candidatus Omnitrophota bacterium]
MKVKVLKNDLIKNIQNVQNVISAKSSLPILSNILIETKDNKLQLTSTDLDIGISSVVSAEIEEEGAITVPAKRFNDIIKELPNEDISIATMKNNSVVIKCSKCFFKILGLPKEDFPKLPEFKDEKSVVIKQDILKKMISMTHFSISHDEARYILNGALFLFTPQKFIIVTTDGKRLSLIKQDLENCTLNRSIIVPSKTIYELNRVLQDEGEVGVTLSENQARFELGNVTIISRLIEGEFPNYEQVIPNESKDKALVQREGFLSSVRRAALLTTQDSRSIKIDVLKNKMVISKTSPNIGEVKEELEISYKGHETTIGFNPGYLIDVLKVLPKDEFEIDIVGSDKPAVIRIDDWYVYLVLPMQLA